MFDFVGYRKWVFLTTIALLIAAIIFLVAPPRLPLGLEFSSGSTVTARYTQQVDVDAVRAKLQAAGFEKPAVQLSGGREVFIRTELIEEGLAPILSELSGKVRSVSLEGGADLATTVSFPSPAAPEDLRAHFGRQAPDPLVLEPLDGGRILISARGLSEQALAPVLQAWRERYGPFERVDFAAADDLALVLRFKQPVSAADVGQELTARGARGVTVSRVLDNEVLLTAKGPGEQDREPAIAGLKERFGEFDRVPIDPAADRAFTIRFTDPVTLAKVLAELAVVPAAEAAGAEAAMHAIGSGTLLVQGKELTKDQAQAIQGRIQERVGPLDVTSFDGEGDLTLSLNFGPAVSLPAFRAEATSLGLQSLIVEAAGPTAFSVVGENVDQQKEMDLLARLESRFGLPKRTTFEAETDLSLRVDFDASVDRNDLANEVSRAGISDALVTRIGGNTFFVGAKGVSQEQRNALTDALAQRFGPLRAPPPDPANTIATVLDFGPLVTLADLRRELIAVKARSVAAIPDGENAFLLAGKGPAGADLDALLASLESRLGLAKRTPFDRAKGQLFTVRATDAARAEQAVRQRLIVQDAGDQTFFLGGKRLSAAQNDLLFSALGLAFGRVRQEPLNFGSTIATTLSFETPVALEAVRETLERRGYTGLTFEQRADGIFIRGARPLDDQRSSILRALEQVAPIDRTSVEFDSVDAEIARRSITNTVWAIVAGSVAILLYVWYAFRRVNRPFRYGVAAVVGLVHDVFIMLGTLALLAKFSETEFNSLTIVGILAIIGYSVNNTIVVFDRIRENVGRHAGRSFDASVNISLNETLIRNLNTTLTTIVAILAVLLFGGETIRDFMLVLLVGVVAGLYNSQFLAANILVSWEKGELRLPFRKRRATA